MEIYTIQDASVIDVLSREGVYRPSHALCMDAGHSYIAFRLAYRFMIDALHEACGTPLGMDEKEYARRSREDDAALAAGWEIMELEDGYPCLSMKVPTTMPHPVWGFYKISGRNDGKPDMRSWVTDKPEEVVRMRLDVSCSRLLLSDLDHWHIPLNLGYFPDGDDWGADDEDFDRRCKATGLAGARSIFADTGHIFSPEEDVAISALQRELIGSWRNCFVDAGALGTPEDPVPFRDIEWSKRETQCVFWEIREEDVKGVETFTTRARKR